MFGPRRGRRVSPPRPLWSASLVGVFLIALAFRDRRPAHALRARSRRCSDAARRIGGGDFSQKVPVEGDDEMAGLATEFNRMSDRLCEQMESCDSQRVELERSVRRIGEAFASGLDRDALLEIVAETAVSACRADYGTIVLAGREGAEVAVGHRERRALRGGPGGEPSSEPRRRAEPTRSRSEQCPRPAPLQRLGEREHSAGRDDDRPRRRAVRRRPSATSSLPDRPGLGLDRERGAARVVSEQAVSDELTGLANNRALPRRGREGGRARGALLAPRSRC